MAKKRLPEVLNEETVLNPEFFRPDLEELYTNIDNMGNVIQKIENDVNTKYFNDEGGLFGRGSISFISSELETLSSMYNGKNQALNQTLSNKLKIAQLSLQKNKNVDDNTNAANLAREFQKLIIERKSDVTNAQEQFKKQAKVAQSPNREDKDLDERLAELEKNGSIVFTDNERAIQFEKRDVQIRVKGNVNPEFVAIAGDTGEILHDYPKTLLPNKSLLDTAIKMENGSWKCGSTEYKSY